MNICQDIWSNGAILCFAWRAPNSPSPLILIFFRWGRRVPCLCIFFTDELGKCPAGLKPSSGDKDRKNSLLTNLKKIEIRGGGLRLLNKQNTGLSRSNFYQYVSRQGWQPTNNKDQIFNARHFYSFGIIYFSYIIYLYTINSYRFYLPSKSNIGI